MKNMLTFHPNYNLNINFKDKEIGAIGQLLYSGLGLKPHVRCLKQSGEKDFNVGEQIREGSGSKTGLYRKLFKNAHRFTFLHLFHISPLTFISTFLYRMRNRRGMIFVKTDSPLLEYGVDKRDKVKRIPRIIWNRFFSQIDLIGFEDKILLQHYQDTFPKYKEKFILTLSSTYAEEEYINNLKKENIILMVGRFGAKQKNYEIFLELLRDYDISDLDGWKVYLCGGMTDEFKAELDSLYEVKPKYKGIIEYLGFLQGKKELYKLLSKAKIFLHTARWEGDPNIQYEAMFCGCIMCSTDVANIPQNYPHPYGIFHTIDNVESLKDALHKAVTKSKEMEDKKYNEIQSYFLENLTREKNLQPIIEAYKQKK